MSKAVLVLDEMPKYCAQCDLEFWADNESIWMCEPGTGMVDVVKHDWRKRPDWCPLRDLPQRKETDDMAVIMHDAELANRSTLRQMGYNKGWNDCLDGLGGSNGRN